MSEGLLTEEEVKTYLELDHPAVQKLVRKGKLTAYRLGGILVRYRKDEVVAVKNGRKFQLPDRMERSWFDKLRDFCKHCLSFGVSGLICFLPSYYQYGFQLFVYLFLYRLFVNNFL